MPYRRNDSPTWWASYTDHRGQRIRRSTGTTDRKEAQALEAKWRLEAHQQRYWDVQPAKTFDQLMLAYLKATAREKRSHQRDRYSAKRLYEHFTGRDLGLLSRADVQTYIDLRKAAGMANGTIKREIGLMSAAINYAKDRWDWNIPNPASRARIKEPEGRARWLTKSEAVALVHAAEKSARAPYLPDFILLALHTGMRRGELLGLEWARVDLQAGIIRLEAHHTKSAKRRTVPLNEEARAAILSRHGFRMKHCPTSPWVICDQSGNRLASIRKSFGMACMLAGISDFHVHDLRHTFAAWLISAGVPLAEIRDLLGHSTVRMTERYSHLAPENLRDAVRKIEGTSRFGHVRIVELRDDTASA